MEFKPALLTLNYPPNSALASTSFDHAFIPDCLEFKSLRVLRIYYQLLGLLGFKESGFHSRWRKLVFQSSSTTFDLVFNLRLTRADSKLRVSSS
jgi:hypothetical protein